MKRNWERHCLKSKISHCCSCSILTSKIKLPKQFFLGWHLGRTSKCLFTLFVSLRCGQSHYELSVCLSQCCECEISGQPCGDFLTFGLKDEQIRFWWSKVKVTMTSCLSHSCDCNTSGTSGGNFITSGTNIYDSRMNWFWIEFAA